MHGNVRPNAVMTKLKDLCKTKLYKDEGVVVNHDWEKIFNETIQQEQNNLSPLKDTKTDENENDIEMVSETLVHGYGETNLLDDLSNKIIEITPLEHFSPLGIFQDKYSEELNFPTHLFGFNRPEDILERFSYQHVAKWEL